MIQLPRWVLTSKNPAFYETESATSIEMVAKLYGAMQTLVDEYNAFAESTEQKINKFVNDVSADHELFKVGIRQEFQDFIDVVDLRLQKIESDTVASTQELINAAIKNGSIKVTEVYDPNTESLNMNVSGGV